jgi:hypothetical protein
VTRGRRGAGSTYRASDYWPKDCPECNEYGPFLSPYAEGQRAMHRLWHQIWLPFVPLVARLNDWLVRHGAQS